MPNKLPPYNKWSKDGPGPCDENVLPKDARCQEASIYSFGGYLPCSAPATKIVRHDKDRRSYYMCEACADHNVKNRGGKLVTLCS